MSEVAELLQRLIRVDTTNPPGNETAAAELLREYLEAAGVECELYARTPERANLVARIPGKGDGPSLAMLSHTDVVLANPAEWSQPPFGGELIDGVVWGRGALDMKGEVAASAVAMATLAREGWRGDGDLIFIAAADEEGGTGYGLAWLVEAHPDACRADYSVNEGAGDRVELGGKTVYLCATAEKMTSPFMLRVHGRSGHASMPGIADNALVKAGVLLTRLGEFEPAKEIIPEVEAFFRAVTGGEMVDLGPIAQMLLEPLRSMTISPTMITASEKRNVIPALVEIAIDCRLLPGMTPADGEAAIRAWLDPVPMKDWELENIDHHGGTRSRLDGPLWDAVETFVAEEEPDAVAAPICVAGFTDSHWMREAFGTIAYGFFPSRALDAESAARLIHSADERVPVSDLELGVRWLRHAGRTVCGG